MVREKERGRNRGGRSKRVFVRLVPTTSQAFSLTGRLGGLALSGNQHNPPRTNPLSRSRQAARAFTPATASVHTPSSLNLSSRTPRLANNNTVSLRPLHAHMHTRRMPGRLPTQIAFVVIYTQTVLQRVGGHMGGAWMGGWMGGKEAPKSPPLRRLRL